MRLVLTFLALCAATPVAAQVKPQPGTGDPRVQSVEYNADQVVLLQAVPGYQLTVELSSDERIENIAVGNAGAWQVTANKRGDRIFIKPIQAGVPTNMVVATDIRVYAFDLTSVDTPRSDMPYTVRFRYAPSAGSPANAETTGTAPIGRYRVSGDNAIRPSAISEEGGKTYIQWGPGQGLPAVYAIDAMGQEMLVNGNMRDGIYVIDSVVPRLVFRLDKQIAHATRVSKRGAN